MRPRAPAVTALVIGLAACSSTEPNQATELQLTLAQARWNAAGVSSYEYTLALSCGECPGAWRHPRRIRVQNGLVVEAVDLVTNTPPSPDVRSLTVPQLFDEIREAMARRAYRLHAQFDGTYGYPRVIAVDLSKGMVDDEWGWSTEGFRPLP